MSALIDINKYEKLACQIRREGSSLGIEAEWPILLEPLHLNKWEASKLEIELGILLEVFKKLPQLLGYADVYEFGNSLGISNRDLELIGKMKSQISIGEGLISRWDLYKTEGGHKCLELNTGSRVGGFFIEEFAKKVQELGQVGNDSNTCLPRGGHKLLLQRLQETLQPGAHMAFVDLKESVEETPRAYQIMAEQLSSNNYFSTTILGVEELQFNEKGVFDNNGKKIDVIYRLFDLADMKSNLSIFEPLFEVIDKQQVVLYSCLSDEIFSDKSIFALLNEKSVFDKLQDFEQEIIQKYIPKTEFLTANRLGWALENKSKLVVKPTNGYGGQGVTLGHTLSDNDWKELLNKHLEEKVHYILQEFIEPHTEICIIEANKAVVQVPSQCCYGLVFLDVDLVGGIARGIYSKEQKGIVNVAKGAFLGSITAEGMC